MATGLKQKLTSLRRRPWRIEGRADLQVTNRVTVWKVEAVPIDVRDHEVKEWIEEQVTIVFGRTNVEKVWMNKQGGNPDYHQVLGQRTGCGNEQDGAKIEAEFRNKNVGLNKWGNRNAVKVGKYNDWKFEVESAKEAEGLIVAQLTWKGKIGGAENQRVWTAQWTQVGAGYEGAQRVSRQPGMGT
ncbi:hypothetical protein BGX38DRAFT_1273752 [Terfezia claveryi]|nr:hypothetical protein BGX38DRAFT_1273752 [Terfezia claveryi]